MNQNVSMTRTRRIELYDRVARRFARLEAKVDRTIAWIAGMRLAAFLVSIVCGTAALYDSLWMPYGPVALVGALVFGIAVYLHRRPFHLAPRIKARRAIAEAAKARLTFDWDNVGHDGREFLEPAHPEWSELQLFGRGSVYQMINRCGLSGGRRRLAKLLTAGIAHADIEPRQRAADELSRRHLLRHRVETESRLAEVSEDDMTRLIEWAEGAPKLNWLPGLRWLGVLVVVATWVQIMLTLVLDWVTAWQATFLVQLMIFIWSTRHLTPHYAHLIGEANQRPIVALRHVFAAMERPRYRSEQLQAMQRSLIARAPNQVPPSVRVKRFEDIVDALAVRHSALLYAIMAIGFLWEVWHSRRLEQWRLDYGGSIRGDLEILFDFEALASVGSMARDEAHFVWPELTPPSPSTAPFTAEGLGHPLIRPEIRVVNDFGIARTGDLFLVTGSNMSGKSTFLRTLGINARLALAGAPVCAKTLKMAYCGVVTSIQVVDAPEEGMSRFYAEVKRLAHVLDVVESADPANQKPHLFLIDEMLSGTNSRERGLASQAVVRRLVESSTGFGLVTTHDLALVAMGDALPGRVHCAHFADRFDGDKLHFDYTLKPGVSTTTNALHVLRMEGIHVQAADAESP
ncbi:MAG: hypothetical protein VX589_05255 [Myxococcota bacterium]|nr:hypothetical protein [Myxococcota bacterium]